MHVSNDETRCEFPDTEVPDMGSLSGARSEFAAWLDEAGFDDERIDELSVAFSELVANAVRESPDDGAPPGVQAGFDGDNLVLEVSNEVAETSAAAVKADWDLNDPLRTGGRGLLLVSAFVDEIEVDVVDARLVIRCIASP